MNQSIHMIDLLQYFMGEVEQIAGFTSKIGHPQIETEDTGVGILQFKNKALGVIYGTTASWPGQNRRLEITGTRGTIVVLEDSLKVWKFAEMNKGDEEIMKKYGSLEATSGVADPAAISFQNHARNMAAFIKAIEEQDKFEIDGKEARKSVALIRAIYDYNQKKNFS